MAGWQMWATLVGGILAVAGQWVTGYWLPVIGGVLAIIGSLGMMSK
ncbi:MAG: hypothetical protein AABW79_02695 [Nanoarchaeota archaeon]